MSEIDYPEDEAAIILDMREVVADLVEKNKSLKQEVVELEYALGQYKRHLKHALGGDSE